MKTILIPVDFSDHSVSTFKYAISIAGTEKLTKLHFHHSYNDQIAAPDPGLSSGFDNDSFLNVQLIEEFRKQAEHNMKSLTNNVTKYLEEHQISNMEVESSISGGDADWEILNCCREVNPDFIVMGTQGTGKKEIFEGSVAKNIMNKADVPVIAVPIGNHDSFEELKIMYACNNHNKDFQKINLLLKLFKNIPHKIFVTHFHFGGSKDKNINLINDLEEAFKSYDSSINVKFSFVDASDKDDTMELFAKENNINTIAFISHKTNIFKYLFSDGITKHDFYKLGLPMIALHE